MIATYVGMFLGLVFGLIMAGPAGGMVGVFIGMALGLLWFGVADVRRKPSPGREVVREGESILCVPKGRLADVTFTREAESGRWLDVERCTLCDPEDEVGCAKRCLLLVRDAMGRRRPLSPDSSVSV